MLLRSECRISVHLFRTSTKSQDYPVFGDNIVKLPQGFDEQRELGEKTRNAVRLPIRGDVRILGFCILGRTQNISLTPLPNVRFVSPSVTRGGLGVPRVALQPPERYGEIMQFRWGLSGASCARSLCEKKRRKKLELRPSRSAFQGPSRGCPKNVQQTW